MSKTASIPVEHVAIDSISKYPRNPRHHSDRQIEELKRSVTEFGQYRPLVIDEDGVILAGNGLHEALTQMGHETVEVRRISGLSEEQKVKLVLADNRLSDLSSDNYEIIEELLSGLTDYEVPGYDPEMIRELLASSEELTAEASEYGNLAPETIERLNGNREDVEEENARVKVGEPPAPPEQQRTPPQIAPPSSEAQAARERGDACPSCGRGW